MYLHIEDKIVYRENMSGTVLYEIAHGVQGFVRIVQLPLSATSFDPSWPPSMHGMGKVGVAA
jgi:hypothetical protein